jgi:hypothetical protein
MKHPQLGELIPSEDLPHTVEGRVEHNGHSVGLVIDPDDQDLDAALSVAVMVVASLKELDRKARAIISQDLLEEYNSYWNEYELWNDDGTSQTIRNPKLHADEFERRFILYTIKICGVSVIDFWYEDDELFSGHSVFVSSFDGIEFADAKAQLYG